MEPRNYKSGAVETPPAPLENPSFGYPTPGNAEAGIPSTVPGTYWHYMISEEMRNVIVQAGLTPDYQDLTQFSQALATLVAPKASQPEVDAGENDTKFVTPSKLRWGFSALFEPIGYLFFPSWLGGFGIQWGNINVANSGQGTQVAVNLPVAYTSTLFQPFAVSGHNANYTGGMSVYAFANSLSQITVGTEDIGSGSQTIRVNWFTFGRSA